MIGKKLKICELIPDSKNANKHTECGVGMVQKSLQKYGAGRSILIDKNNKIIAGNLTAEQAATIGIDDVVVVETTGDKLVAVKRTDLDLNDKVAKELAIADNRTAEVSLNWDAVALEELKIEGVELAEFFADGELEKIGIDKKEIIEDEVPEPPKEARTVKGDIYELGRHRVMCGDSTNSDDVAKLMDGKKAEMVFTDPPYKIEIEGGCIGDVGKALRKQGKDIEFISNFNPMDFLNNLPTVFDKNKINAYVFCNKELLPDYLVWAKDNKYSFNCDVIVSRYVKFTGNNKIKRNGEEMIWDLN